MKRLDNLRTEMSLHVLAYNPKRGYRRRRSCRFRNPPRWDPGPRSRSACRHPARRPPRL